MSNQIDASKILKALDVLNLLSQTKSSNNEYFGSDIQNLISTIELSVLHIEVIEQFTNLGKKLCNEKLVNNSCNEFDYFDIAIDFFETHFDSIKD